MNTRILTAALFAASLASSAGAQTFFFTGAGAIADGGAGSFNYGAPRILTATSNAANPIQDLVLTITMNHTWIGDLRIKLSYAPAGSATTTTAFVLNRTGLTGSGFGEDADLNGTYVFVMGSTPFYTAVVPLSNGTVLPTGSYSPCTNNFFGTQSVVEFADFFRGQPGTGTWTLSFEDGANPDIGTVTSASIGLQARTLPCLADFNTDGVVNSADLTFFLGRFGNTCSQ